MYPFLFNQASRLAPQLSRLLMRGGSFASPFWKTQQIDIPAVNAQPMPPQPSVSPPISGPQSGLYGMPSALFAQGSDPMTADVTAPAPAAPAVPMPAPRPQSFAPMPSAPMPMARPADAPQAQPDTGFFMRNALMQQDPITGGFLDPSAVSKVSGPDLISKMMAYLHKKDMG